MTDPNVPAQPDPNQPAYGQQPPPPQQPSQPQPGYNQPPAQQPPVQPQQGYQQPPPGYQQPPPGYQQPPPGYQQQPAGAPAQPFTQSEENMWGMLSHLIPIISIVCIAAFKDRSARLNANAKEALNFQITAIGAIIALNIVEFLFRVIFIRSVFSNLWGVVTLLNTIIGLASLVWLVFAIIAAVKTYQGENYRYPFALRLIK